jgi:pimeloyl-ACP methyl ester carboxylesterase
LTEELQIGVYGDDTLPTLVYLPGLHGDWTLITGFRLALAGRVRFVEVTYPRSLTCSIPDYVNDIEKGLLSHGINRGWLIGESFGSQFAWQLIAGNLPGKDFPSSQPGEARFKVDGLILAGGFVKHPWKHGPALLRWIGEKTPMNAYRLELKVYAWYSRFRHRNTPATLKSMQEFVERRTDLDRQAMRHRLVLLDQNDPRPVARQTRLPVHYLAGLLDPLVPWPLVRWWLRKNCPGYRGGKTFWLSDHNVLATSPARAADLVVKWMKSQKRE